MRIRLATPGDAEAIAAIYRPIVEHTVISFEAVAPDADTMRARIAEKLPMYPWLVAADGDAVLGYVSAGRWRDRAAYRWSVETTAYVAEGARGRGVGRTLYEALFRVLALQRFRRAFAGIALPNAASIALHEAVGFTHVGTYTDAGRKFDRWIDVAWYQRAIDATDTVGEPLPLADLAIEPLAAALDSPAETRRSDAR